MIIFICQQNVHLFIGGSDVHLRLEKMSKQFGTHHGWFTRFELSNREDAFRFINKMKPIKRATNLNDNKSHIISPVSTI